MQIQLEKLIKDELNEPIFINNSKKEASLGVLILSALAAQLKEKEDMEKRWDVIKKINSDEREFDDEELSLMKKYAHLVYLSPVIVGRIKDELGG